MYEIILYSVLIIGVMSGICFGKLLIKKLLRKPCSRREIYLLMPVDGDSAGIELHLRSLMFHVNWGSCRCTKIIIIDNGMSGECREICRRLSESSPLIEIRGGCAEIRDIISQEAAE